MKRFSVFLILIIIMGNLPIVNASENYYLNNMNLKIYQGTTGYDTLLKPDGSTLIQSQRYTIEYLNGKQWRQITTPINTEKTDTEITRNYSDYLGTTAQITYREKNGGTKTDITINSANTREYRIHWSLDGITNTEYEITENGIKFISEKDWVLIDWGDAYTQHGDITEYTVTDSANGKKLDIYFNIGIIEVGTSFTLDPYLVDSWPYASGTNDITLDHLHPDIGDGDWSAVGQSFTVNTTRNVDLDYVEFYLFRFGAATGNATAKIYAHTGVFGTTSLPTGAALATSDPVDISTIGVGYSAIRFNFTGANAITLTQDEHYVITFEMPTAGTVDATHYIKARYSNPGTHPGNMVSFHFNAWGVTGANFDLVFYVYTSTYSWNDLGEAIDEAFGFFGIIDYMNIVTIAINDLSANFIDSVTSFVTLIGLQFQVVWQVYDWVAAWLTRIITGVLNFGTTLQNVLNGIATGGVNIWTFFNFNAWIDIMPLFLILVWIDSMAKRATTQGTMQVLYNDLNAFVNVFAFFTGIFTVLIGFIEGKVSWLFQALV